MMLGDITQILGPDDKETNTRLFKSRPGSKLKGITTDITTVAKIQHKIAFRDY